MRRAEDRAIIQAALRRFLALIPAILLLTACAHVVEREGKPSMLDPRGPRAAEIEELWWIMFWPAAAVFALVVGLLLVAAFRPRSENEEDDDPKARGGLWSALGGNALIVGGGIIMPLVVLIALIGFTGNTLVHLAEPPQPPDVTVEVIGYQFWWEVRYPDAGAVTANEIHIPVGEPVALRLTSVDVIHSLWVPQLMGKIDLIPGDVTTYWIQADLPGIYYAECAEFCGVQHAKMQLLVVAESREEFAEWVALQAEPALPPDTPVAEEGLRVFFEAGCNACHTIRGTPADGDAGPDLTHLESRLSLAAGSIDNTPGNLLAWIVDPQEIKPGNEMPPTLLENDEITALVTYLLSLD